MLGTDSLFIVQKGRDSSLTPTPASSSLYVAYSVKVHIRREARMHSTLQKEISNNKMILFLWEWEI